MNKFIKIEKNILTLVTQEYGEEVRLSDNEEVFSFFYNHLINVNKIKKKNNSNYMEFYAGEENLKVSMKSIVKIKELSKKYSHNEKSCEDLIKSKLKHYYEKPKKRKLQLKLKKLILLGTAITTVGTTIYLLTKDDIDTIKELDNIDNEYESEEMLIDFNKESNLLPIEKEIEFIRKKVNLNDFYDLENRVLNYLEEADLPFENDPRLERNNNGEFIEAVNNNTAEVEAIFKYSEIYGVDPFLSLAVSWNENLLSNTNAADKTHGGHGLFQHEVSSETPGYFERTYQAYNFDTNEEETLTLNYNDLSNINLNAQAGIMNLQEGFNTYYNNPIIALQSHNFGSPAVNFILDNISSKHNVTVEEVCVNHEYTQIILDDFMAFSSDPILYTHEVHPAIKDHHYITSIQNWVSKTYGTESLKLNYEGRRSYGDGNYVGKVLAYYMGENGLYKKISDGEIITYTRDYRNFEMKIVEKKSVMKTASRQ